MQDFKFLNFFSQYVPDKWSDGSQRRLKQTKGIIACGDYDKKEETVNSPERLS